MTPEELIDQCGDFSDSKKRALASAIREAVDAARAEERTQCLQTIRDYAAECRMTAAESWTQGEALKYLLKASAADALAYALRLKEPTQ